MSRLTREFFRRATKTDLFASHVEEMNRYLKPPRMGSADTESYKRWLLLNLASRWEWLGRLKWMEKKED